MMINSGQECKARRVLAIVFLGSVLIAGVAAAQQSRVFVTSTQSTGDLGGLAGADQTCEMRAAAGDLGGGPWVAWLSTSTVDAVDRIGGSLGPFVRPVGGDVIADDVTDLTNGDLDVSIGEDELGNLIEVAVWTGTTTDGVFSDDSCLDWTSGNGVDEGTVGASDGRNSPWTENFEEECSILAALYCFENPAPVPTLPWLGWFLLAVLLAGVGAIQIHRQRHAVR